MINILLEKFEEALRNRNPILADRLQPGLPLVRIRKMLKHAKIDGVWDTVEKIFAWKNGTRLDPSIKQHASPFPNSNYMFIDLELMFVDFTDFEELTHYHPEYGELVGRYFPIFWDGSTGYLGVDLKPSNNSRVVLIDPESGPVAREVYPSFENFLKDAIRANNENDTLVCFQKN